MRELTSTYQLFESRVNDVELFICNMMLNNEIWSSFEELELNKNQKHLLNYIKSSQGKTIQYNAVIISLYGCFENYIDSIFSRYIDIVFANTHDYDSLPPKIADKYRKKIADYLVAPHHFYGFDYSINDVIGNFHKILNSNFENSVCKKFLLMHSGNLKMEQLSDFARDMGIANIKNEIFDHSLMKSFLIDALGIEESAYAVMRSNTSSDLSKYLDTLVQQRNDVAHGWVETNRISAYDLRNYYIPYIKVLAEVILRILLCEVYGNYLHSEDSLLFNKTPIAVYNDQILCLHINGQVILKGNYILYKSDKKINCGKIESIEINKKTVDYVNTECNVGLKLDSRIKNTDEVCAFIG